MEKSTNNFELLISDKINKENPEYMIVMVP